MARRLPPTPTDGRASHRLAGRGRQRKVRYRGVAKNNAWLHTGTAALNLRKLLNLGLIRQDGTWAVA